MNSRTKIVITGGPSGGKTTLIEALRKEFPKKVKIVPEAASVLYKGGFPRLKNKSGLFYAQIAIYHTQKSLEQMLFENSTSDLLVCDRGSLDALAYWPNEEENFFQTINSNVEQELKRYDWVIHLDTPNENGYDNHNEIRTETHEEALVLNGKTKKAWEKHPQRIIISAENDFFTKMKKATDLILLILEGKDFNHIKKQIEG